MNDDDVYTADLCCGSLCWAGKTTADLNAGLAAVRKCSCATGQYISPSELQSVSAETKVAFVPLDVICGTALILH